MYSTYLGGTGDDFPLSMFSDPQGEPGFLMGRTYSANFPGKLIGPGGATDLVVVKLNAGGTGLIGALRIGGTGLDAANIEDQRVTPAKRTRIIRFYGDDSRGEVILDGANNIYLVTQTQSTDFRW